MQASQQGDVSVVKDQVSRGSSINLRTPGGTPLHVAAAAGHEAVVAYLLKQGANPNLLNEGSESPLMAGARSGNTQIVRMLLAAGADVNYLDSQGGNAVGEAALAGHLAIVKLLLKAGGNVNIVRNDQSLLMLVVAGRDLLIAQVLINAGADVNFADKGGRKALDIARANRDGDLEMLLVQAGAQ